MEKENKKAPKKTTDVKKVAPIKKPATKKLTVANVLKEDKKLDKKGVDSVFMDGTEYEFEYDLIFRPTKQEAVLNDVLNYYEHIDSRGIEILAFATPYVALLIIKHFTSLDVPQDFDEAILLLNVLVDNHILDEILNKLPNEQVKTMTDTLHNALEVFLENLEGNEREIARLLAENQIENDEVIDTLPQIEQSEDFESEEESDPENPLN